ncbi:MAG: flavodoxin family protein [Clostridia bacterium]|nr:flavodoxin family protein [Clostridia bacterium]
MENPAKKMLIINGSPRKDGCTSEMINFFAGKLSILYDITVFDCFGNAFSPCCACGYCEENDGCVYSDMDGFFVTLEDSDAIVIASPVYFLSYPAPLKNIIDRCQRYYSAHFIRRIRPTVARPKLGALLLCGGSDNRFAFEVMEKQAKQIYSIINTKYAGMAVRSNTDSPAGIFPSERLEELAEDFIRFCDQ